MHLGYKPSVKIYVRKQLGRYEAGVILIDSLFWRETKKTKKVKTAVVFFGDKPHMFLSVSQVRLDDRVVHTDRGLLIRSLHSSDAGVYVCVAQERTHFAHTLLRLTLQLVTHGQLDGKPKPSEDPVVDLRHAAESRQRYKDYLRVMSSPFSSLEEYCDSLWLEKRPSRARGRGMGAGKWKHIQEMKKNRNRRHHRETEER